MNLVLDDLVGTLMESRLALTTSLLALTADGPVEVVDAPTVLILLAVFFIVSTQQ